MLNSTALISDTVDRLQTGLPIDEALAIIDGAWTQLWDEQRRRSIFGDGGLQLREAWVGAKFGKLAGYSSLTLARRAAPGFDVVLERLSESTRFDVTEAMDRLRDRVAEFDNPRGISHETHAEITYQEGLFSRVVGNRLKRKQDPNRDLVVYVNTGWKPDVDEIEALLARWHGAFKDRFRSAYLLLGKNGVLGVVQIAPDFRVIAPWNADDM